MKRPIVRLAVAAFCVGVTIPQVPAQAQGAAQKIEELAKTLHLNPQQKAQLLPILREEAPKIQSIKNDPSLTGLQKVEQMRAVHQETDPQVQSILTAAQYQQLQGIRQQEIKQYMQKKRGQ